MRTRIGIHQRFPKTTTLALFAFLALVPVPLVAVPMPGQGYLQVNLDSNLPGMARRVDHDLVNPWGVASDPEGRVVVVADNGTGLLTEFAPRGFPRREVTLPTPEGGPATSAATGLVFNPSSGFLIRTDSRSERTEPSRFITVTEEGTIVGWNAHFASASSAVIAVDRSNSGAIYKGVAIASTPSGDFLYSANFHEGVVEMYDDEFQLVRSFTDTTLPAGFAPFNISTIGDKLYIAFAQQDTDRHDEVAGAGLGYVDVFDAQGNFMQRLISQGELNAPWGLALAPHDFGRFSDALMVGNFGDGRVNAFDPTTGSFLGTLETASASPFDINGLWGLTFRGDDLVFAAGINDEADGLFGFIRPIVP